MCGIVGTLVLEGSGFRVTEKYLTVMRETLHHRGPDGEGNWISPDGRVGLGHRRLSIIDLSTAAGQPMSNADGSMWIVYNGEVYNHVEIRRELESLGWNRWKTEHSDTEVILHAFEQWGIDCIHRFRGMFAFAIWDVRQRTLWLVRDRIGIKPLYYSLHDGRLVFASEIKAILKDPDQKRQVDSRSLYHYLSFLTTPAPQTIFEGIYKIAPGCWLKMTQDGRLTENRYWELWDSARPAVGGSQEEIAEQLLENLRDSVRLRKVSDVPVGVFLSGGMDSSLNTALFAEGQPQNVETFTVGYKGEYKSNPCELKYARMMAGWVGARHHEVLVSQEDLLDFLPKMVEFQDEALGDPVSVPLYYVSKLARECGVTVCQVGEGADELFWGYPAWKIRLKLAQLNDLPFPNFFRKIGLLGIQAAGKAGSLHYELLHRAADGRPTFWGGVDAFTETQKRRLLSAEMNKKLGDLSSWEAIEPIYKRFQEGAWEKSHLSWMSYLDLKLRLPELLLMRIDKMTMGASLEGREPFLDHVFVQYAMAIPESVKTHGGKLKNILKTASRGLVPDELIDRKKQGFGVPVHEWFFDKLGDLAWRELDRCCQQTGWFNRRELQRLLRRGSGHQAWYLLNLALWHKRWILNEV